MCEGNDLKKRRGGQRVRGYKMKILEERGTGKDNGEMPTGR